MKKTSQTSKQKKPCSATVHQLNTGKPDPLLGIECSWQLLPLSRQGIQSLVLHADLQK